MQMHPQCTHNWNKPKQTEAIQWSVTCLHSKGNHKVRYVATKGTVICEVTFTSTKLKIWKNLAKEENKLKHVQKLFQFPRSLKPEAAVWIPPPSPENISLYPSHYTLVQHILNKSFLKRDASPAFLSRVCPSEGNFLVLWVRRTNLQSSWNNLKGLTSGSYPTSFSNKSYFLGPSPPPPAEFHQQGILI